MKFELRVEECPSCGQKMMQEAGRGVFPYYHEKNQDSQMKKQGVAYISKSEIDGKKICSECEKAGKSSFICALCEQRRPTSEIQESFGDPAEHLCKTCYKTIDVETWDRKIDEVADRHKYDFY